MVSYIHRKKKNTYVYSIHRTKNTTRISLAILFLFNLKIGLREGSVLVVMPVKLITTLLFLWKENAGYEGRMRLLQFLRWEGKI